MGRWSRSGSGASPSAAAAALRGRYMPHSSTSQPTKGVAHTHFLVQTLHENPASISYAKFAASVPELINRGIIEDSSPMLSSSPWKAAGWE